MVSLNRATVDMAAMMEKNSIITDKLKKMDKLVITSVAGSVAGAGVSLALSGDFMICADNAKFILAFVNLGLVPDMGLTYLLSKTIGPARTMDLAVTGRRWMWRNSTTGVSCSAWCLPIPWMRRR